MNIQDIIDKTKNGSLPEVYSLKELLMGRVTTIKISPNGYRGIAVRHEGRSYDDWYYEEEGHDRRKKYMHSLVFTNPQ